MNISPTPSGRGSRLCSPGAGYSRQFPRLHCRQSNIGGAGLTNVGLVSAGFSPSSMRRATSAVALLSRGMDCIGSPTTPSPKKGPSWEKIGALATAASRRSALLLSCVTHAPSMFMKSQKIALCGGRAAASFRMSSNDSSL